jgi:hypothetical protein
MPFDPRSPSHRDPAGGVRFNVRSGLMLSGWAILNADRGSNGIPIQDSELSQSLLGTFIIE